MNDNVKLFINKSYFLYGFLLIAGAFLLDTFFLIFGKPSPEDLIPMISLDILYLIGLVFYLGKYLVPHNQIAIELNELEIIDHISNIRIEWVDIYDIYLVKKFNGSYISISLFDHRVVTRQTKNIFKKISFFFNMLYTGTPVKIPTLYVKGKRSEIFDRIYEYFISRQGLLNTPEN